MLRFDIGDTVIERGTNYVGIVVKKGSLNFEDTDGQMHYWNYEVLFENGDIAYADDEDLLDPNEEVLSG